MLSIMLLLCYLPLGLVPAILPQRTLRPLTRAYPILALLLPSALVLTILLAKPLTRWMGYTVVFLPLGLSLTSLAAAVVGIRLTYSAWRLGLPYGRFIFLSCMACLPFVAVSPFIVIGFQGLARYLGTIW